MEAGIFLGQFVINHMLLPGHVERWNLLVNLRKATLLSLPDHIKKLLPIMNEGFISRLNKTYVIGMNFFFRLLYKIVCAFLKESTVKKIKILDGKKDQSMFEEIRIPKDLLSPFILDKLKEEESNKIKLDNSEKNENEKQITPKNNEIENNKNITINTCKKLEIIKRTKEIFEIDKKLIIKRQQEINKVKTFMKSGWEFKEEKINTNLLNYQNQKNLHKNIINEINSLRNKRKFFINNISKISNINI